LEEEKEKRDKAKSSSSSEEGQGKPKFFRRAGLHGRELTKEERNEQSIAVCHAG